MNKFNLYLKEKKNKISVSGISPSFDWKILLGFGLIGGLIGIFFAMYLYINLNNGNFLLIEQDQNQVTDITTKQKRIDKKIEEIKTQNFDETVEN